MDCGGNTIKRLAIKNENDERMEEKIIGQNRGIYARK